MQRQWLFAFVGLCAALMAMFPAADGKEPAAFTIQPRSGVATITYRILRNGNAIGEHRYTFFEQADGLVVTSEAVAQVTLLGFPAYRFRQVVRESWQSGRLVMLDAHTDDNGRATEVRARATADGIAIDGSGGRAQVAADAVPATYWHASTIRGVPLIDTRNGRTKPPDVTPLGGQNVEVPGRGPTMAQRFHVDGPIRFDVWYDDSGLWAKAAFETEHGRIEDVPSSVSGDPVLLAHILSAQRATLAATLADATARPPSEK